MPDPINATTDAPPDDKRRSNFAAMLDAHTPAEAPAVVGVSSSPVLAAAAAGAAQTAVGSSAPRPRRPRTESEDAQAERKFTLYLDPELKRQLTEMCEGAFFDSRGAVAKSDVHDAIVRLALANAGTIIAELNRAAAQQ